MKKLYWLIPLVLIAAQAVMTYSSNHQIRNEEAVASFREVWWFREGLLYQPPNSNVGWYAALNFIYAIFGFDLFWGKMYRLVLSVISLYCLAAILKKYLGEKWAILPLLTIGLSPTLLFWNTLNNPYGIDLQFLPIVAFLIDRTGVFSLLGWFIAMIAWLTYPTFVFYLPSLVIYNIYNRYNHYKSYIFASVTAFLAPLIAMVVYFKGWPGKLFFAGGSFEPGQVDFFASVAAVFTNLFGSASAYYLEISQVEFSLIFPILTLIFVLYNCYKNYNHYKFYIALAFLVIIFNLVITSFTVDGGTAGGRRNTPILAAFYALFVLAWRNIRITKIVTISAMSLILVHHVIAFPLNLEGIRSPSFFKLKIWFGEGKPEEGLSQIVAQIQQKDLYLSCEESYKSDPQCQYGIIYAALIQSCQKLDCHQMYGYFPGVGYQPLSIETINYWQENNFEH